MLFSTNADGHYYMAIISIKKLLYKGPGPLFYCQFTIF